LAAPSLQGQDLQLFFVAVDQPSEDEAAGGTRDDRTDLADFILIANSSPAGDTSEHLALLLET